MPLLVATSPSPVFRFPILNFLPFRAMRSARDMNWGLLIGELSLRDDGVGAAAPERLGRPHCLPVVAVPRRGVDVGTVEGDG